MSKKKNKYNLFNVDGFRLFAKNNIRWGIAATIVFLLILSLPTIYAYVAYGYSYLKCGQAPVMSSDFAGKHNYWLPDDSKYYRISVDSIYFCTEPEARANGHKSRFKEE